MSGKGDSRRSGKGYEENHGRIFGERPKKERYVPPPLPNVGEVDALQHSLAAFDSASHCVNPQETAFMASLRKAPPLLKPKPD